MGLICGGGVREAKSQLFISSQAGGIGGLWDTREQGLHSFQPGHIHKGVLQGWNIA